MEIRELALKTAALLEDKKGLDITIIDIGEKSSFGDYLVMVSGSNERQIGALVDQVSDGLGKLGVYPRNIEGKKESGWILMDYGDFLVNVLTIAMRDKYNIEKIWGDCKTVEA